MSPPPRADTGEWLDGPTHDPAVLHASLAHVAAVNRWLGGRRVVRLALAHRLVTGLSVLDVGTGSADLPRALTRTARRNGVRIRVTATDRHPQVLGVAACLAAGYPEIDLAGADALALPFADARFDVAVLSLVLHHLTDELAVRALREAARVAPLVIVNELHRTRLNYLGSRLLARTVWSRNPLTSHDGPLSVLRAYRKPELAALAAAAGLSVLELRRRWFYRLVMVATPASPGWS